MIRVSIEANDGAHLRHLLIGMLAGSSATAQVVPIVREQVQPEKRDTASDDTSQMQSTGPLAPASEAEQPTPSEQRKRGRPAKVKAEPPAPTGEAPAPADATEAEPPANPEATTPPKELDITDMRAALQAYAAKNGVPAAQALLEKHGGAKKISDLKAEHFAAFYAECKG